MSHETSTRFLVVLSLLTLALVSCKSERSGPSSSGSSSNASSDTESSATAQSNESSADSEATSTEQVVASTDPVHAKDILGNPAYTALCYGGFRGPTRTQEPTVAELQEDLRILNALGIKILRTYNTQQFKHAANLLEAIQQLRNEDPTFEMYVMLGAWIECKDAWSDTVNHELENEENNTAEIETAVDLANKYPDIVKVIGVGNEAMVHWAAQYFVRPSVILRWVNHLKSLRASGGLPDTVWITSSDNFAAWGGGDTVYHTKDLEALIKAVDYISLHTYPFHHTYYDSEIWGVPKTEEGLTKEAREEAAIKRVVEFAQGQYQSTADYVSGLGIDKAIHIGETGWSTQDNKFYGEAGTRASDESKSARYYEAMRAWTDRENISCFYFEAFDEQWKDPSDEAGSENHFGLFTIDGKAKYVLWDEVDKGTFDGLQRAGNSITKTFDGDREKLMASVFEVPMLSDLGRKTIVNVNSDHSLGEAVSAERLIVFDEAIEPNEQNGATYPSVEVKLNIWEGTCDAVLTGDDIIQVTTGTGDWWGCGLELQGGGKGENLSTYKDGKLHFEVRGESSTSFEIGFQTGLFGAGNQVNCFVAFMEGAKYRLTPEWQSYSIPISELSITADPSMPPNLEDVTTLLFLRGRDGTETEVIEVRKVSFSRE